MKKFVIAATVLSLICSFALSGCALEYAPSDNTGEVADASRYIIHAGGVLEGYDPDGNWREFYGSNSVEGLEQCADFFGKEGGAIELDFNFTSDGELVCIHDWSSEYISGIPAGVPLSYGEFAESEIFWNYTPLSLDYLRVFLEENPNVYIVTDIKDENVRGVQKIAEKCPDLLERFVIQIYSADEYEAVRECGFSNVIYTLYMLPWADKTDTAALSDFAKSHPLAGFTFPAELCELEGFLDGMKKSGVLLYVHTVNGEAEMKRYFDLGIDGIYTDYLPRGD